MTDDLEIRRATESDAPGIAALYRAAYATAAELGYPSRMTEIDADTVAEWLSREATTLVATPATDRDDLVGTVRLLEERDAPYLERLAVAPDRQGGGLAASLVGHTEGLARERGYDRIQLTTFEDHPFLYDWYRDRGYEPIERHERPDRPYDFATLEKRL